MNDFISNIFSILIKPPGNLVYYLCLLISIGGSLQGTIALQRSGASPHARRTITGLVVLLIIQVMPFLITPFAWRISAVQTILPPLDRAFSLISLFWIARIWIFPRPAPKADAATVIFSFLTLILLGLSMILLPQQISGFGFNHTFQDNLWQIITLLFIVLAMVVLLIRRLPGFGYGLAILILAGIGHLLHFLFPLTGDYSGVIRFSQIAMYPLLLALPQFISEQPPAETASQVRRGEDNQTFQERRRFSTDPKTLNSFFTLAAESEPDQVSPNITRAIAQSMLADLVYLILIDKDKQLNIACGYDLIREEVLDGAVIDKNMIPTLSNAILKGRSLRMTTTSNSSDMQGLSQIIGLSKPGNVMSIPFESSKKGSAIGAILLLSPYSDRVWSKDDQAYLTNVSSSIVPIMARSQQMATATREREAYQEQINELQKKLQSHETDIQDYQALSGKHDMLVENFAALTTSLEIARREISQLKEGKDLQVISSVSGRSTPNELEQQFRMTLEELAHLQNELGEANSKLKEFEQQPENSASSSITPIPIEQVEILASISQELRHPMSSIIGYIDLLLGESVGIIGDLQRKFLERIKSSTERIGSLIDDLNQITSIETSRKLINPEIIDLNLIIDNAVAYTSTQLREKNITMRLDIPEAPPRIHMDREALQQILIHLLQNAGAATLVEGTVMLRVKFQEEAGNDFLLIQVVDSGGGIPAEDLPKVFARRYRADNVLIQGLGDTGVGLSIAKTLTEAQSGRIWVETSMGEGSTISALLPIESTQSEAED